MEEPTNQTEEKTSKESLVDTVGLVTYSLLAGGITDYASGLRGIGIVASRGYGTAINIPTSAPYGKWRNFLYKKFKTTDKSSRFRKWLTELACFNSFQVPLYGTVIAAGSLASNLFTNGEFKIDYEKVMNGMGILTAISPAVSPTLGLYMEGVRKVFGLKSAPRKARESLEEKIVA